jgi:hypothetical protein
MPASFRQHLSFVVLAGLALASMGCVHHVHQHPTRVVTKSPPPWAAAHGHRHVHQERTLIFDTDLDCYTVVGHSDHFFHRDHYYRWRAERWERSLRAAGPWRAVELDRLPPGLRGWQTRNHARHLERKARSEREERRAEARLEREREQRRAERREREREEHRAEARQEREREERRVAERERQERELALRERDARKLEALEHRRAEERKRKASLRKQKAKDQESAEDDYSARRRAGKEQGVRSDEKSYPAEQASSKR